MRLAPLSKAEGRAPRETERLAPWGMALGWSAIVAVCLFLWLVVGLAVAEFVEVVSDWIAGR